jgi:hypothetical protein
MLARQIRGGEARVENEYSRVVRYEGNVKALNALSSIFEPFDVDWRGFPVISGSGMRLRNRYEEFDARKLYEDELEGRMYELKKGLAEPLIVVRRAERYILVDGHHRVIAAKRMGITRLDAYLIEIDADIELGIERTARAMNLNSLDDIKILDYARHPLVALTHRLIRNA